MNGVNELLEDVVKPAPAGSSKASGWGPSREQRRRRRLLLLLILLLLSFGSFWLGRLTVGTEPAAVLPVAPASAPTPSAAPAAMPVATVPAAGAVPKIAVSVPPAASATIAARPERETTLLEVSVGTSNRGGLTLVFDHPVDWTVQSPTDGHAELDVEGVRALGVFPRNLPLPPCVKAIHAVISAPDTLNLKFDLKPGIQAYTLPGSGPASSVNVYFRTPLEQASVGDSMWGVAPGSGGCGPANPAAVKAATLLQQSLDKNPGYAPVREALAVLMTCNGQGTQAEQLLAEGLKIADGGGTGMAVVDAALLYARGDTASALQMLKRSAPAKADRGYDELLADLKAAAQ